MIYAAALDSGFVVEGKANWSSPGMSKGSAAGGGSPLAGWGGSSGCLSVSKSAKTCQNRELCDFSLFWHAVIGLDADGGLSMPPFPTMGPWLMVWGRSWEFWARAVELAGIVGAEKGVQGAFWSPFDFLGRIQVPQSQFQWWRFLVLTQQHPWVQRPR